MAVAYHVQYLKDAGLTLAHSIRPIGSPARQVMLSKINLYVASHPRVIQLKSERHGLDCWTLKCRHARDGHHPLCAVRRAKLSAMSELVRECVEAQANPVKEIVTASSVGWRPVKGSDEQRERDVLIQVPLEQACESDNVGGVPQRKSVLAPMRFTRQANPEQGYDSQ